ncbi:MAG TPA: hypothetical protein VHU44_02545 [Acidobacteriaceae bacterium]|nr:hypothetical protein [Acidobacteriaceae bacterium]
MNPHEPFNNPNPPEEMSDDFTSLERELRQALRPVDPPAGFADRVIARTRTDSAAQPKRARILMFPVLRSRVWIGSAVAALLLVGVVGEQAHRMEQRRKAEEAQKQFETALQVTDRALEHTRQQLERAGIPFGD